MLIPSSTHISRAFPQQILEYGPSLERSVAGVFDKYRFNPEADAKLWIRGIDRDPGTMIAQMEKLLPILHLALEKHQLATIEISFGESLRLLAPVRMERVYRERLGHRLIAMNF